MRTIYYYIRFPAFFEVFFRKKVLALFFILCYTLICSAREAVRTEPTGYRRSRQSRCIRNPCGRSDERRLQTRRRKTRETPPENLREPIWGISTVGSARHSHCRGQEFESPMLHQKPCRSTSARLFRACFSSLRSMQILHRNPRGNSSRVFFCPVRPRNRS